MPSYRQVCDSAGDSSADRLLNRSAELQICCVVGEWFRWWYWMECQAWTSSIQLSCRAPVGLGKKLILERDFADCRQSWQQITQTEQATQNAQSTLAFSLVHGGLAGYLPAATVSSAPAARHLSRILFSMPLSVIMQLTSLSLAIL